MTVVTIKPRSRNGKSLQSRATSKPNPNLAISTTTAYTLAGFWTTPTRSSGIARPQIRAAAMPNTTSAECTRMAKACPRTTLKRFISIAGQHSRVTPVPNTTSALCMAMAMAFPTTSFNLICGSISTHPARQDFYVTCLQSCEMELLNRKQDQRNCTARTRAEIQSKS